MVLDVVFRKPEWAIASALSIVYVLIFALAITKVLEPGVLLFGFCVFGKYDGDDPSLEDSQPVDSCTNFPINSHWLAFVADALATALVFVFYFLDKTHPKEKIYYPAFAAIILVHGLLHWWIQQDVLSFVVNCFLEEVPEDVKAAGSTFFLAYSFGLSFVMIGFGLWGISIKTFVASGIFTFLVNQLSSLDEDSQFILPSLFVVSHPVACIVGLFSDETSFSPLVGRLFAICTVVGILELFSCKDILRPLGGHLWYDVTLHAAVIAALPYFWPDSGANSKKTR